MLKIGKRIAVLCLLLAGVFCISLVKDKAALRNNLIRLHVVANSDSEEDQQVKLQVRDAVIQALDGKLDAGMDMQQVKAYISTQLPRLEAVANETLKAAGSADTATVSVGAEEFPVRYYDTFSLPSGVYESLRITIGEGEGKNWWCVVFPSLCIPATADGFADVAAAAGFSEITADTLTGAYEIRFFLLDCMGKVENFLSDF